ncbi:chitinase-like protein 4 isoform X2 [Rhipicephalus microplus]|uniref:chitinase-like protein 4 isoform X2 n=1 Tax=Rhipicephalus microplus TaxID=6941 RepID=UPI003F6BC97A
MALNATQLAANLTAQLLAQSGNALSDIRNVEYAMGTMAMLFLAAYYRAYSQLYKHYKENLATYRHPDDRRHRYYEMKRVCYYLLPRRGGATDWSSELNPDVLDDTLCTHVLVGALAVSAQGRLVTKLPKHEDLISKISRSKLKVLLSVDAKDTTALSYVVAYRWTRLRFIRSAMRMVWRYKLSGINLDWQIPGWLSSHVGDRYLFRLLLQDFRSYMKETKKAFLLSASICAIPAVMPSTYDVRGLSRYVDFINLVAHDLDIYRPWRPNTSHHSPLFPKLLNKHGGLTAESCVSAVYQWAQLGMPHEKIVLGIPLYARIYRLADSSENKWGSKALGQAILPFNKVCQLLKEGSVTVMDKMAYAPYAYLGDVWISYENVESVVLKHGAVTNISRRQNRDAGAPTEKMEAAYVPPGAAAMEPRATDKVQAIVTS